MQIRVVWEVFADKHASSGICCKYSYNKEQEAFGIDEERNDYEWGKCDEWQKFLEGNKNSSIIQIINILVNSTLILRN